MAEDTPPEDIAYEYYRGLVAQPNCKGCPLEGGKIIPPEGNPRARIAIVGEAPGFLEEQENRLFVGPAGQMLNHLLTRAGIDRKECWTTNSVLCKAKTVIVNGKPMAPDNVVRLAGKFCKSRLDAELAAVKPKVVIGLGAQALRSVYAQSASMKGRRGAIHTLDLDTNKEKDSDLNE